jgi:hypothetical protein
MPMFVVVVVVVVVFVAAVIFISSHLLGQDSEGASEAIPRPEELEQGAISRRQPHATARREAEAVVVRRHAGLESLQCDVPELLAAAQQCQGINTIQ